MAKHATTWSCVIDKCPAREVLFSNENRVKPNPPKRLNKFGLPVIIRSNAFYDRAHLIHLM